MSEHSSASYSVSLKKAEMGVQEDSVFIREGTMEIRTRGDFDWLGSKPDRRGHDT